MGVYEAQGGECAFLSVPYDSGMQLKINGKKAALYEVYDGFIGFYLQEGVNNIQISYQTPGFILGLGLFLTGCALFMVICPWSKCRKEVLDSFETSHVKPWLQNVTYWALIVVGVAVIALVYLFPLVISGLT